MFEKKYGLLPALIGLLLSISLLGACSTPQPTAALPEASPTPEATNTPEIAFTSPLSTPTALPELVMTAPVSPISTATPDPNVTPVVITDAALGPNREVVTIKNISAVDQDISAWTLFNVAGGPAFHFPDGVVLKPGDSVQVYSAVSKDQVPQGAYFWTDQKIWNEFPADVLLVNRISRLVFWYVAYSSR